MIFQNSFSLDLDLDNTQQDIFTQLLGFRNHRPSIRHARSYEGARQL
jgi:hypothetical protein